MDVILVILSFAALYWVWLDNRNAHATAVRICRQLCKDHGVLLLDDTVSIHSLRLRRDINDRVRIWRHYQFEFTDNVAQRYAGNVTLLGMRLVSYSMGEGQVIENE